MSGDALHATIAEEYGALAGLLEAAGPDVWDAPSLCEKWRTRGVVAHVTMPPPTTLITRKTPSSSHIRSFFVKCDRCRRAPTSRTGVAFPELAMSVPT